VNGPLCTGHSSRTGLPCQKQPIKGSTVCRNHGGSTPQVKRAAEKRLAQQSTMQAIGKALIAENTEVTADPLQSLMRMVQTSAWAERAYAQKISADLGDDVLTTIYTEGGSYKKAHPYLELWNEERDRLAKFSKLALDAGVAEKQLKVEIAQIELMASALDASLDEAGISAEQRFTILQGMAKRLKTGDSRAGAE